MDELKRMFTRQYLPSLRERYQHIVQIKGDSKNRDNWKVGRITSLILGSYGKCQVAKVRVGETDFTRSIGHLYPLEIEKDNSGILIGEVQY